MKLIATIILDGAEIEIENNRLKTEGLRPDILHHCLITILDSSLSKSGKLRVFFRTLSNQIFYISHKCRIPRTFNEFSFFLVELVTKFKIRSKDTNKLLAKAVKGDFLTLFGENMIGLSSKGLPMTDDDWSEFKPMKGSRNMLESSRVDLSEDQIDKDNPMALITDVPSFVVGVRAHEGLKDDYGKRLLSISTIGLSAAHCCAKLISEIEHLWQIN